MIELTKNGKLWHGLSMFYNGRSGKLGKSVSCDSPETDADSIVAYTDFVADRSASKASIYLMQRNESSTENIQDYGMNNLCSNYPAVCEAIGDIDSVDNYFSGLDNPFCVERGTRDVVFNSTCEAQSQLVSETPFKDNNSWITPTDFYQMDLTLPDSL